MLIQMSEEKTKITFNLPKEMNNELREKVVKDGYGMRGKSRWVQESVESLLVTTGYEDLVSYSDEMGQFETVDSVMMPRDLKKKIDKTILEIRKKYPGLEGIQSRIVRTAILQRLIRA